jgi:hypothetical protein
VIVGPAANLTPSPVSARANVVVARTVDINLNTAFQRPMADRLRSVRYAMVKGAVEALVI